MLYSYSLISQLSSLFSLLSSLNPLPSSLNPLPSSLNPLPSSSTLFSLLPTPSDSTFAKFSFVEVLRQAQA